MSKSEEYTSAQLVPREPIVAYGDDLVKIITDTLYRTMSEKVFERANCSDVIVSLKPMRITERQSWDQVEYRQNMTVADLVRCKDCRDYQRDTIFDRNNCRRFPTLPITKDFFCPYGERKDNEADTKR